MEDIYYYSNTKSCQVDIPEFQTLDNNIHNPPVYDNVPHLRKKIKAARLESEKSKIISQRRIMASVGKKASKDQILSTYRVAQKDQLSSNTKNKNSNPFFSGQKPQNDFCELVDTQSFIKQFPKNKSIHNKDVINNSQKKVQNSPEHQFFLPKIVEKKESAPVYKKGKLGPLVHSPYREIQPEDPSNAKVRKYSYFHIRNFSVHENYFEN